MQKLLENVLKKITPSMEEAKKLKETGKGLCSLLEKELSVEVKLLGSVEKDTFVKGQGDIDVFALFDKNLDKEEIGKRVFSALKKLKIKFIKKYAEHPYARANYNEANVDIAPAYKIKKGEKIASAVDRSVFHAEYVKKHLKKNQRKEVLLLKQFLKNLGIYGAEIGIKGFSGYLCELLIIEYGSFENLVKKAQSWKIPMELSNCKDKKVLERFKSESLLLIDPVDSSRNVASPVSAESLGKFIFACRSFLKNPREEFFFLEKMAKPKYSLGNFILAKFKSPKTVDEVKMGQLSKICRNLSEFLEQRGFSIKLSFIFDNGTISCVFIESGTVLSKAKILKGPFISDEESVKNFRKKHKEVYVKKNRIYASEQENFRTLLQNAKLFGKKYNFPSYYSKKPEIIENLSNAPAIKNRLEVEIKRKKLIMG